MIPRKIEQLLLGKLDDARAIITYAASKTGKTMGVQMESGKKGKVFQDLYPGLSKS